MNPKFRLAALAVVVIAGGVAWWAAAEAARAEEARAAAIAEADRLGAQTRRIQDDLAKLARQQADTTAALDKLRTVKPGNSASPPRAKPSVAPMNIADVIAKDPKLQLLEMASHRAEFETTYGPLLSRLHLSSEQAAKLGDALAKAKEQRDDLAAIMREQKLPASDPGIARLREQSAGELAATEQEVLGADGMEQLHGYERTLPAQSIVERFAGSAALAAVPVSDAQAEQLVRAIAAAGGSSPGETSRVDPSKADWSNVDEQARAVLSPEQFALFTRIEPIGGGDSRWSAQFNRAFQQAMDQLLAERRKSAGK